MHIPIDEISKASHIMIECDSKSFALSSVLYTYILTLHKKVSIVQKTALDTNLCFLPWFDKVRRVSTSTADFVVDLNGNDVKAFFNLLQASQIKINKKMATALYAALLLRYDSFRSSESDGDVFAIASELISLGADYKVCREFILNRMPLSRVRLKAVMYKSLLLKEDATKAELFISDRELKSSGASLEDVDSLMREVLTLVNVKEVTLFKSDENGKKVKNLKEK